MPRGLATIGSALGCPLLLLEFLDDLALLPVLCRPPLGGLNAGGDVPLRPIGDLVARLGVRFVPLAFLYVAPAVYAPMPALLSG
jgi:hypothetical protein